MEKLHICKLKILDEFKQLTAPISNDDLQALSSDIIQNGCLKPISIWRNIIVDGHLRYEICSSKNIPFATKKIPLRNRNDVILWICANQLLKPNLTQEMYKYLIGKEYNIKKIYDMPNTMSINSESGPSRFHKSPFSLTSAQIKEKMGKKYNISSVTVLKYEKYAAALDILWKVVPALVYKILLGEIIISQENVIKLSLLPDGDSTLLRQLVSGNAKIFNNHNEIKRIFSKEENQMYNTPASADIGGIKNMPSFDPDAEISSLTLTIPSWINSINRTRLSTDTKTVTKNAHCKLEVQLVKLEESINLMLTSMKEDINE